MVAEQVYIFLCSVLIGSIMGIIFDFFRSLRRKGNTKNIIVYIQDIIFWFIIAVIIITSSFILNSGELRAYMLIGYILGALIYMLVLSNIIRRIFGLIFNAFEKVLKTIIAPFMKLVDKIEKKTEVFEKEQDF